jgi:hypothetical protein
MVYLVAAISLYFTARFMWETIFDPFLVFISGTNYFVSYAVQINDELKYGSAIVNVNFLVSTKERFDDLMLCIQSSVQESTGFTGVDNVIVLNLRRLS